MKVIFRPLLLLLFCPFILPAQTVRVSEPLVVRDNVYYEIIGDSKGNVLLFRDQNPKFEVFGYDPTMNKRWDKELELDKKRPEIVKVIPMGHDFCVVYQFRLKSDLVLKAHRYSPSANLVDSVTIKDFGNRFSSPGFQVTVSEDKSVALFWFTEKQNEITAISFHMGNMKVLWEKTFTPDGLVFYRDYSQTLVDNNGNMYFILKKDNQKSKQTDHYLEVFHYGESTGENLRRYLVNMQGRLTFDADFAFDHLNNRLIAGGLYSENNLTRADGFFYLNLLPADTESIVLKFHPFESSFVAVLLEKDKTKNKGIPEVTIQEIVLRRDGGILLVGEMNKLFQRGVGSTTLYTRSGFRAIIDYYYNDVFLISIHPHGEVHWKNILHKKQYSQDDDAAYSSYFLMKTPTALRLIFNDEIKAENTVSEYVIRGDGDLDRNAVMNTQRKDLQLRFRDAVQISANELIVPSQRRNKLKLVKIAFNENR